LKEERESDEMQQHSEFENYMTINLITKDIRIEVITKKNKKLLEAVIKKLFGSISMNNDSFSVKGDIKILKLIDLITLKENHLLLGCSRDNVQALRKVDSKLINEDEDAEESMITFELMKYSNEAKVPDHIYMRVRMNIFSCYIDYLHAT
jgi:hypothetical protein